MSESSRRCLATRTATIDAGSQGLRLTSTDQPIIIDTTTMKTTFSPVSAAGTRPLDAQLSIDNAPPDVARTVRPRGSDLVWRSVATVENEIAGGFDDGGVLAPLGEGCS